MNYQIKITATFSEPEWEFLVVVEEGSNKTEHRVKMSNDFYKSLNTNIQPEEVVKKSFDFLLEREPKEMILSEFNITLISHYFPEYIEEIKKRLGKSNG